jgi:NAD(P)-dependent dehydrogenase (short-subunit alcohol dehydrogenase family)
MEFVSLFYRLPAATGNNRGFRAEFCAFGFCAFRRNRTAQPKLRGQRLAASDMTVSLVTGANRGLGFETARQLIERGHTVYIGSRSAEHGEVAAAELGGQSVQLDVTDDASVQRALAVIRQREGHLDVLVNNAGISTWSDVTGSEALRVFDTNAIGLIRVIQAAMPLLSRSDNPVVVNVSSALGSFWAVTNPERRQFHFPSVIYGASKAAVSMLTVQYAKALPEIKFNAVEPGFTATDLTPFSDAGQPVEKGAEVIVRMATIGKDGPTGTFWESDGELGW